MNKQNLKRCANKCFLCDITEYTLLDVHRIYEGEYGGTYEELNCIILCSNCHRLVHSKMIKIIKKHKSYGANLFLVEVVIKDIRSFLPCNY